MLIRLTRVLAVLLVLACTGVTRRADARTIAVDTTVDDAALSTCEDSTPDDCSLRGAITAANAGTEHFDILLPPGTYGTTVVAPCTFASAFGFNTSFTNTTLCIHKDVSIIGSGAQTTILDGLGSARVLAVDKTATVAISGVTITHGTYAGGDNNSMGGGAGLINHGTTALTEVVVTVNVANGAGGGGIANAGTLIVRHSTISNNETSGWGGGINNEHFGGGAGVSTGTLTLIDSTIARNTADDGGGIVNSNSVVTINGSTLSGNTATLGGAIFNQTDGTVHAVDTTFSGNSASLGGAISSGVSSANCLVTLNNVTITGNSATNYGGGVANVENHVVTLANTILAGNTAPPGVGPDCFGPLTSGGYDVIGETGVNCQIGGDPTGNQVGVDPQLGMLAPNGGATATHAPLAGSPALEHGSPADPGSGGNACAAADQRGALRPIGARCDVGAVERSATFSLTAATPSQAGNEGAAIVLLSGGGLAPDAGVVLRRTGHADIVGSRPRVDPAGFALATTFELTGADLGDWDIVVTNPDAASATLPGGFTVEAVQKPDVFAVVLARSGARRGLPARFAVLYGNRGNVDALGVPLTLDVPASFARSFPFGLAGPPAQPGQAYNDYRDVPFEVTTPVAGEQVDIPLLIPIVPAGFTGLLEFTLTPPVVIAGAETFTIEALVGTPWFANGSVRADIVADAATRARQYATNRLGVSASPDLDPALIAYETAALELAVASARDELLDNFGQSRRPMSLAYLAMDLAGYVAAQTMASAAPPPFTWLTTLPPRLARALGLVAGVADAETICPPCVCGAVAPPGCYACSEKDCNKPPDKPKPPQPGLTPAECYDQPGHTVSADGTVCKPDGSRKCPKGLNSPFSTDPSCTVYPLRVSRDPNDKAGSGGAGAERFVAPRTLLPYLIAFENVPTATAAAQTVVVTDQLDTQTLDLDTFALGPILVGEIGIVPPPGRTRFSGGADLRPAHDVLLRVDAGLDKTTGIVTWRFTSLDPSTMETLTDPDEGFLPPDTNPPEGDGQVHFTILPKGGLASGTEIRNHATVVFDDNPSIDTPEWLNTIDGSPPASQVDAVDAAACDSPDLTVRWSGIDGGSAVASFTVFFSEDQGPFVPLVSETSATSAPFTGAAGKTYAFYSVARDHTGNVESPPASPDVVRTIGGCGSNDLAVTKIAAPKTVTLTGRVPARTALVRVTIQNRSPHAETVGDVGVLANLVHLGVESLAPACVSPAATLHVGKPQKRLPLTLKSKKKLAVAFDVPLDCANDAQKGAGHEDYQFTARVDHSALGTGDAHPADDGCPRTVAPPGELDPFPDGKLVDKGCGAKKADQTFGAPILVDVVSTHR